MILALLLAAVPCADPGFCPTRAELERAIESDRQALEGYLNHVEGEAHPESLAVVTLHRPRRITGMSCGKPFEVPPRALECRFTLHYPDRRERRTATLAKVAGGWRIVQAAASTR